MTAIDMAREHPGTVHAAIAIHPNEAVLHGHRGAPGPDGLPIKYKPWHDIPFDEAMAEVHRLATTYPNQVVAIGETGMDLFRTGEGAKELQREAFRAHVALAKELNLPMQIHDRDSHKEVIETLLADGAPNVPCSTATPATPKWAKSPAKTVGISAFPAHPATKATTESANRRNSSA